MSSFSSQNPAQRKLLADILCGVKLALRELIHRRQQTSSFKLLRLILTALAFGIFALTGITATLRAFENGLSAEGRSILGGDISVSLIQREVTPDERSVLAEIGTVHQAAFLRAMVSALSQGTDDKALPATLGEIKALELDDLVLNKTSIKDAGALDARTALADQDGLPSALVEESLLAKLALNVGDKIKIGAQTLTITAVLSAEPDTLAAGLGFGPRAIITLPALQKTGLLQPGSLVRWTYRLVLPAGTAHATATTAQVQTALQNLKTALPNAGFEIRDRDNAVPQLSKNLTKMQNFLSLLALCALMMAGSAIAGTMAAYLAAKRQTLAILKTVGANAIILASFILTQVLCTSLIGISLGLIAGLALPFALAPFSAHYVSSLLLPDLAFSDITLGFSYGLITTLIFVVPALDQILRTPVSALLRANIIPVRQIPSRLATCLISGFILCLLVLTLLISRDKILTSFILLGASLLTALFMSATSLICLISKSIVQAHEHSAKPLPLAIKLALANFSRPHALARAFIPSFGLCMSLLVMVVMVQESLRHELVSLNAGEAPDFFFLDIPHKDADNFEAFLRNTLSPFTKDTAKIVRVPMLRGRIIALGGVPVKDIHPKDSAAWALEGDRGITYANEVPDGSTLTQGTWWSAEDGASATPKVSFESEVASGLGLKLGDTVTLNVLGRTITATIVNLRTVNWRRFGLNFVMVFTPGTFAGAPFSDLASFAMPQSLSPDRRETAQNALLRALTLAYPNIVVLRMKETFDLLNATITKLGLALSAATSLLLAAAFIVQNGTLAASRQSRISDSLILKLVGARTRQLLAIMAVEYLLLGVCALVLGLMFGGVSAALLLIFVLETPITLPLTMLLGVLGTGLFITLGFALLSSRKLLNQPPLASLRGA